MKISNIELIKNKTSVNICFIGDEKKRFRNYEYYGNKKTGNLEVVNKKGEFLYSIGLWFENKRLVDYDGVFGIDKVDIKAIRYFGFIVPEKF